MNTDLDTKPKQNSKIMWILALFLFILVSSLLLFSMNFIRDLFGVEVNNTPINLNGFFEMTLIAIIAIIILIVFVFSMYYIYTLLPITGELIENDLLLQKKKLLPRYRATYLVKIKGLPRRIINEKKNTEYINNTAFYLRDDIVLSLAQVCDEFSYWIYRYRNRIHIIFTVSGWNWFSQAKAIKKAEQGLISLQSAFKNVYPSILFEELSLKESNNFLSVINSCTFGLEIKGIPAHKENQNQIDRMINSINNINEECFFVVNLSRVKKGRERNTSLKNYNKSEINEFNEDFNSAKKTGQSTGSVYSFAKSEIGMFNLFASILSIWSGTHTFKVDKLGDCKNKRLHSQIKKLCPKKNVRLSNKAFTSFIHLPEKPFLTEDTGQPIFEIPSYHERSAQNEISIGNIVQNENLLDDFTIPLENLLYNTEIVGMIGRGKTYLTAAIIEQLLERNLGCLIFDLKGEYARLFAKESSVIIYTIGEPSPLGINLFKMKTEDEVQNILALISEMLTIAGTPFSPTMLNIFENALIKISKQKDQNIEVFMKCLKESSEEYNKLMKTSYSRESIDAILNRLNYIFGGINYEVFNSLNNTIDFSDLDAGNKIILDLSEYLRRGANTASLFLVCNLILHLLSKYASMKGITNKLRYLVILEEAMYLIPKRFNLESTASIGYSEQNFIMGRSLGIGTISIYQLWESVSSVVHANSITKILFRGEDNEKVRSSIALTEDQLDYLSFLPDRHFIIKSKSLSGPALLKTKDFYRKPISDNEYYKLIKRKFQKLNIHYTKIPKNLMEVKRMAFGKQKANQKVAYYSTNPKSTENNTKKVSKLSDLLDFEDSLNENYWENCITSCPARVINQDKHSLWIKENICKDIQKSARNFAEKILQNSNLSPLINIIEKNPRYFIMKILKTFEEHNSNDSTIATFCTINLILEFLRKNFKLSYSWKNSYLNKFKVILTDESLLNPQ